MATEVRLTLLSGRGLGAVIRRRSSRTRFRLGGRQDLGNQGEPWTIPIRGRRCLALAVIAVYEI